jgi:hypothetical protein
MQIEDSQVTDAIVNRVVNEVAHWPALRPEQVVLVIRAFAQRAGT